MLGDNENQTITALEAEGLTISRGKLARHVFIGGTFSAGKYYPMICGPQPAVVCPPRRKGGNSYDAIAFKNANGSLVKVSLGSIFNSIRIVTNMNPANLSQDALWKGEAVQPTANYFRFGALADMPATNELDENNQIIAFYTPAPFTLTTEVVYVEPRFESDKNTPIFDEQCHLRRIFVVEDYLQHPHIGARR